MLRRKTSHARKFALLMARNVAMFSPLLFFANNLVAFAAGLLIGFATGDTVTYTPYGLVSKPCAAGTLFIIFGAATSLPMFGADREVYLREREHLSSVGFFLSKQLLGLLDLVCLPFSFVLPIHVLCMRDAHIVDTYLMYALLHWVAGGFSQYLSLVVAPRIQLLLAAVAPCFWMVLFAGTLLTFADMGPVMEAASRLLPGRYHVQMLVYQFLESQPENVKALPPVVGVLTDYFGFSTNRHDAHTGEPWHMFDASMLLLQGVCWRLLAFL